MWKEGTKAHSILIEKMEAPPVSSLACGVQASEQVPIFPASSVNCSHRLAGTWPTATLENNEGASGMEW